VTVWCRGPASVWVGNYNLTAALPLQVPVIDSLPKPALDEQPRLGESMDTT